MVFSFPLISPLLSAPRPEAKLPPCCRKDGKHACGMMPKAEAPHPTGEAAIKARKTACPLFPAAQSTPAMVKADVAVPPHTLTVPVHTVRVAAEQAEAQYRISFNRSCQKRGPPSFFV
jgi:hypothetical protein